MRKKIRPDYAFIAMEYVEGQTRDEVMGRHSVKLSEA